MAVEEEEEGLGLGLQEAQGLAALMQQLQQLQRRQQCRQQQQQQLSGALAWAQGAVRPRQRRAAQAPLPLQPALAALCLTSPQWCSWWLGQQQQQQQALQAAPVALAALQLCSAAPCCP